MINKINIDKILNIKTKDDLKKYDLNKPIYNSNYLFHYLIQLDNLNGLKLYKVPIYETNNDNLNGFHLAAKEGNIKILSYLIKNYEEYIYNRNIKKETWMVYLPVDKIILIMNKFKNLDWENLLINGLSKPYLLLKIILTNLEPKDINKFIDLINIKPEENNQWLVSIIKNPNLKSEQKIEILKKFNKEELNMKNHLGEGLIQFAIIENDKKLFNFLLKEDLDLDYYSFIRSQSPLRLGIYQDILNNNSYYTKSIFDKIENKEKLICSQNKNLENLAHFIGYIRFNRLVQEIIDNNFDIDKLVLSYCNSECWNMMNDKKETPIEIFSNLSFEIYSKIIKENNIKINKLIINKIKDEKWKEFLAKQEEYKEENNINFKEEEYSHSTEFQSKFKDVGIFVLYLKDKYKDLYIPETKSYEINNLTWDHSFPFSDDLIQKEPVFPWIITYYGPTEYHIHSYLNNLINASRQKGDQRFGTVFLSLITDKILHANLLIYDFEKMTVERFEPYGNTINIDNGLDDILEEELTWNTGLKYIGPKDYLPWAGFQTISDEENLSNLKAGDFGGFCLAWCLFYLENRLGNKNINQQTLVKKLINKMRKSNNKFSEIIRNYANKINKKRIEYLKKIGIEEKQSSNIYMTQEINDKIADWFVNKIK